MTKERLVTPVGEAKWAHLSTPKTPYDKNKSPQYMIDVIFDTKDPQWKVWASALQAELKALPEQIDKKTGETLKKQVTIKRELDEEDNPTGRHYVTFKTGEKFKPPVVDKYGDPLNKLVGNGSKVRVAYVKNVFTGLGGGINLYLNGVQVVELVEYESKSASNLGFPTEPKANDDWEPAGPIPDDSPDLPF